jgi:hypothetical protein
VITHKAIEGYYIGTDDNGADLRIIGCYECFDSANAAAIKYVRETVCSVKRSASVITVLGARVVYYEGNESRMKADSGPTEIDQRTHTGWDLP